MRSRIITYEHDVHPNPHVNSSPVCLLTVEEDGDAEALEKTADKSSSSAWADSKDTWPLMCVPKDIVKKHPLSHPATKHVTLSCSPTPSFHRTGMADGQCGAHAWESGQKGPRNGKGILCFPNFIRAMCNEGGIALLTEAGPSYRDVMKQLEWLSKLYH